MHERPMDQTITVLTIDLVPGLAERLRLAGAEAGMTLRDVAIEALEEWLGRRPGGGARAAD